MKICCDQGCNDIGVVVATKWSHYLLCLQQYFSVATVVPKSITGAFSSNSRLDVREVKTESVSTLSRYFGMKFLSLEKRLKRKILMFELAVIWRKRTAFDTQFHLIVVSIFLKIVWKVMEIALTNCYWTKKDVISMYHGALVSGFANISVYFNKLMNNF